MPNVGEMVSAYESMLKKRNGAPTPKPPDALVDPLADPLSRAAAHAPVTPAPVVAPTLAAPSAGAAPSVASSSAPPVVAPTSAAPPSGASPSSAPPSAAPAPKTKAALAGGAPAKVNKTWAERNDEKPWAVSYTDFAAEGHTSHHLIPDNSLLSLGRHITEMGLWGQKDTQAYADEFIMRDVLANTDPAKHAGLKAKIAGYTAKKSRSTGELGGKADVQDSGLQGVMFDGEQGELDDEELKEFSKKFQGAFEWRPANTVLGPTSSLRWDDPKDGFDVPATLLAYGDKGTTEEIAQNSKNIKAFNGNADTATAPGQLATIMQGLTKQNRAGEAITGKDAVGKPLPFMSKRTDWVAETKSNKADLDKYDKVTTSNMDKARASKGGEAAAQSISKARTAKRPAPVSKDGFVTNTNAADTADIRSRLGV